MSTITREQLHERAREKVKSLEFAVTQTAFADSRAELEEELELARIALASLEAEAVGEVIEQQSGMMMDGLVISEKPTYRNIKGIHKMEMMPLGTKFYTAPPAPANAEPVAWLWSHRKHPREVTLVRPEDDEKAEAALWSGWSCQALCAAPPAPVSVPEWTNEQCLEFLSIAFRHAEIKGDLELDDIRLGVKMVNGSRAAMLQGAENAESRCTIQTAPVLDSLLKKAESRCSNSPMALDGWVACSDRMPEDDDFVYIWPRPDFGVELHVGQYCECHPKGDGWYAQVYEQNYGIEWYPINVTHWIPLPAAPQQEVKP
ncbi:DUF551 domain-containing protein [Enterobacter roggenkampii]|uniref:DUF551 domain-containing protein n=1 Tax=Enterobacter roggenkampii TaxID=1812935 RepID=UPI002FD2F0C9